MAGLPPSHGTPRRKAEAARVQALAGDERYPTHVLFQRLMPRAVLEFCLPDTMSSFSLRQMRDFQEGRRVARQWRDDLQRVLDEAAVVLRAVSWKRVAETALANRRTIRAFTRHIRAETMKRLGLASPLAAFRAQWRGTARWRTASAPQLRNRPRSHWMSSLSNARHNKLEFLDLVG